MSLIHRHKGSSGGGDGSPFVSHADLLGLSSPSAHPQYATSAAINALFQAVLVLDTDTNTQIRLRRFKGRYIEVNGLTVEITNFAGLSLLNSANTITSTGADSGVSLSASTTYCIYVSNADANPFPTEIRASTTSPTLYNGVPYLGTSGNAANWRFVGWIRTTSGTLFADDDSQRLVLNYYNRRMKRIRLRPGYNDNNAYNTYTITSTTWVALNSGTGARATMLMLGSADFTMGGYVEADSNYAVRVAIYDSGQDVRSVANLGNGGRENMSCRMSISSQDPEDDPIETSPIYRYLEMQGVAMGGGTHVVYADLAREGTSTYDTECMTLCGSVLS